MEQKIKDLVSLWNTLQKHGELKTVVEHKEVFKDYTDFSLFIGMNKSSLIPLISQIEKMQKPSKEYLDFFKKKADLFELYSFKDPQGKSVKLSTGEFAIAPDKKEEFDSKVKDLEKENKKVISEKEAVNKSIEDFFEKNLDEDKKIKLVKIKREDLHPEVTGNDLTFYFLFDLIVMPN